MPVFFAIVIGLSILLLAAVFRSVVVPIKAALMNLLSIGATYGVLVAVFQWGWGKGVFGIEKTGPVDSFLPMMLFAILFGLSMDYEVFLLSRIREDYLRTRRSARGGGARSERDGAGDRRGGGDYGLRLPLLRPRRRPGDRRSSGSGSRPPIFIDATIVRLVLVPSTMELLGDWNWWFPRWLDRLLPRLNVEGAAPVPVAATIATEAD